MPRTESWHRRVLAWFDQHGRHDLPWQHPRDPYRVWVSEIMLQQTTVATVIPYFLRFIERFPDVHALAAAPQDAVLAQWSGLGYYARARNLHRAAEQVVGAWGGEFPADAAALESLPGIGRSTAAAILAQSFDQPAAILDGNVKRLLARHAGIDGWPGRTAVQRALWQVAEERLAPQRHADYAQALMDLGATVCARRARCEACPVAADCVARQTGRVDELPGRKPRRARPLRQCRMLIVRNDRGAVLLEKRPASGIWGGLWSLPQFDDPQSDIAEIGRSLGLRLDALEAFATLRHEFTHFSLDIQPLLAQARARGIADEDSRAWFGPDDWPGLGLPQPVRRLLERYLSPASASA